jgi:adenylylsulfate kinase
VSWAVWLTGPPASGKTTVAREVLGRLAAAGRTAVWLESDALRKILTPRPDYSPPERGRFYAMVADLAALLCAQGFDVLVDATAPRREHRRRLRERVASFVEVLVAAPAAVREARDPKGLYRRAREGDAPNLPGATAAYEEPERPDLVLSGTARPGESADRLLRLLREKGLLPPPSASK